jgi:hypothetical protein
MPVCEFAHSCPIFNKSITGAIRGIYSVLFCKGSRLNECERRKRILEGVDVPITLLPTGNHMMSLAEK